MHRKPSKQQETQNMNGNLCFSLNLHFNLWTRICVYATPDHKSNTPPHSSPGHQFYQHPCFTQPVYIQQLWTTHLSKLSNICGFLIWFWFLYTWGCVYETKPSYYSPPGPSLPRHFQSDTPTYFSSVSLSIWIFIKKKNIFGSDLKIPIYISSPTFSSSDCGQLS